MSKMRRPSQKYNQAIVPREDMMIAEAVHEFVNQKIMPYRRDLEGGFHRDRDLAEKTIYELAKGLVGLDIQRAFLPKEIGGMGLTSVVTTCILAEEMARGDIGLATQMLITPWAFTPAMLTNNQTVLNRFAAPFCGDEPLSACFAMTEPAGGANIEDTSQQGRTIQTIARREKGDWIINGQKIWPSGAGVSEIYLTVCTVDPEMGEDGITLICVPKDTPGLSFGPAEEKMGLVYTDKNTAIYFENVRVPEIYCCAQPGGEGANILREMISGRISEPAMAVGAAQAALEIAIDYTKDRSIKGKAVRDRSLHAALLGDMTAKIQVARSDYMCVASMLDQPERYGALSSPQQLARVSASKLISTRLAQEVIHAAIELMGSYGYCADYHVEKYLRDVIIVRLTMGGPQLCALETARGQYPLNLW